MLSPEMLKSQIQHFHRWERGIEKPTFDVETINDKILHSHFCRWRGKGIGGQLLMLSSEMLKSQIHIVAGGGGVLAANF